MSDRYILMSKRFPVTDYKIAEIKVSDKPMKKYMAIVVSKTDPNDMHRVHFGAIKPDGTPYQHFKDLTPLKYYAKYDHGDVERMKRYQKRHGPFDPDYITPNTLSWLFLWTD